MKEHQIGGRFPNHIVINISSACAGTSIQSITAAVKTQDQAILVAGLANCTSLVLHVTLSNRSELHAMLMSS